MRRLRSPRSRYAGGALVVGLALVVSEETRVLVLLIGFAAVVAALAGPWSLRFWRLVQPSLFAAPAGSIEPSAPAPVSAVDRWSPSGSDRNDDPIAAD